MIFFNLNTYIILTSFYFFAEIFGVPPKPRQMKFPTFDSKIRVALLIILQNFKSATNMIMIFVYIKYKYPVTYCDPPLSAIYIYVYIYIIISTIIVTNIIVIIIIIIIIIIIFD